jgi:hypothetical protein
MGEVKHVVVPVTVVYIRVVVERISEVLPLTLFVNTNSKVTERLHPYDRERA